MRIASVEKSFDRAFWCGYWIFALFLLLEASAFAQSAPDKVTPDNSAQNPGSLKAETQQQKAAGTRPAQPPPVLQQLNSALEELSNRISPAVVQVLVTGYGPVEAGNRNETALIARQHALGSGVIVDPDGYIMTNAHVVEGAQRIHVALPMRSIDMPNQLEPVGKQRIVDARLIGLHKETDLALLKIDQTGLPTLSLGAARPVHQGQLVFAMGSPEGLQNSVTMGVVSSVGRQPDPTRPMVYIQTDAPINPGNSGGPLV
ncbi:MAG TPA: trypsin-like peptidase domain-containing protein, partial [Terriglobales bacterium]|nr:trypsin-like peptidase domain-containing protein [Terriglobales bacterium]